MPALSPVYTILMHFLLKILNNLLYTLISLIAVHYLIKEETIPSVAVRISRRLKSDKKIVVSDGPSWRPLVSLLFLVLLVPEKTSTSFFRGQCFSPVGPDKLLLTASSVHVFSPVGPDKLILTVVKCPCFSHVGSDKLILTVAKGSCF